MFINPMYSRKELAGFVINRAVELDPTLRFSPGEDELTFTFVYEGLVSSGTMHLHSLWHDYSRTGDLNRVVDFLNAQFQTAQYLYKLNEGEIKGIDLYKIYPALRRADFFEQQKDADNMLRSAHIPRLSTAFIENHTSYYVFLNQALIKPVLVYMNEEEIKQQAYTNLRKRGWNSAQMTMPSMHSAYPGQTHVFSKTDYPFQYQFFLPDMSENHLPRHHLIAIPAQDMAVVFTADKEMDSLEVARRVASKSGFADLVQMAYANEPKPLSNNIYWANGDRRLYLALSSTDS
jgi:uncharacterized protein YtpQ (UPF0354 family)